MYERGLEALQRHDYRQASAILESVLRQYPEEKELHERVRLYLNVCQRQATPRGPAPQTIDERLYAATLAINGGQYDQAIAHLRLVRDEDPDNDHALYMLAVAHAQRDEHAEAVAHLERAIALNPENRALARNDPDLEPLHDDESFRATIDAPSIVPSGDPPPAENPNSAIISRPGSVGVPGQPCPTLHIVVLAAGKGTRMKSARPKVLHRVAGRPMIDYVLTTARSLAPRSTTVVVGHQAETLETGPGRRDPGLTFVVQEPQLGTAHALLSTADARSPERAARWSSCRATSRCSRRTR